MELPRRATGAGLATTLARAEGAVANARAGGDEEEDSLRGGGRGAPPR